MRELRRRALDRPGLRQALAPACLALPSVRRETRVPKVLLSRAQDCAAQATLTLAPGSFFP
jgi:hypothetical protein